MDTPVAPSSLLLNESFYGSWDSALNPKLFIQQRYRETACLIKDKRSYTDELIKHLEEKGAKLLERTQVLDDEDDDGSDLGIPMWDDDSVYTVLYKDNVITYSEDALCVYNPVSKPNVIEEFKGFLKEVKDARVSILLSSNGSLYVDSIDFEPPVVDIDLNYGAAFPVIHEQIVEKLNARKSGVMLFFGAPGVGKSNYIKYLTSQINREFIFIPVAMASELSSPAFIKTLLGHKEAVLILEDAEQAIQSREEDVYNSSTVSTLLNISDGILGTMLNLTIICTCNADKKTIDKALLRKGRLSLSHVFEKLNIDDAKKLATHLNKDIAITEPTSLADIYNANVSTNYVEPVVKTMGFGFGGTTPKA